MSITESALPDADTNGVHDILFETLDYTHRIHWWVRLCGVVWLIGLVIALLVFIAIPVVAMAGSRIEQNFDRVGADLGSGSGSHSTGYYVDRGISASTCADIWG